MKKLLYIMVMALAVVFTACDNDFAYPPIDFGDIQGNGTFEEPYNVAAAIRQAGKNGPTSNTFVFVAGYVSSFKEFDVTNYGNASLYISDSPDNADQTFYLYRIKYFNNAKFTDESQLKVGDYIVIYAPIVNYMDNTPETGAGGYVISVNGEVGSTIPDNPSTPDTPDTPAGDPEGDGSVNAPFNVAAAINVAKANGETSDVMYYITGYVTDGSIDTSHGNATWHISANADLSGEKFYIYRIKDFGNKAFTDANKVKVGDKIVVYAPIINYKGNTPETGSGGYLYSINGQTDGSSSTPDTPSTPAGDPEGDGSVNAPFNVAAAINVAKANGETSDVVYYTQGYVISGSINMSYGDGTWVIADNANGAGATITVYHAKGPGNKTFTDENTVKVGDKIVVCAPLINYKGNTPETKDGYVYSINGHTDGSSSTPDTPATPDTPMTGAGTEDNPYTVADVIGGATGSAVWTKGYIVGWIDGAVYATGANFNSNSTSETNLILAASPDETDPAKCVPVQLPAGTIRSELNLKANPGNYKKQVILCGSLEQYFRTAGIKSVSAYKFN